MTKMIDIFLIRESDEKQMTLGFDGEDKRRSEIGSMVKNLRREMETDFWWKRDKQAYEAGVKTTDDYSRLAPIGDPRLLEKIVDELESCGFDPECLEDRETAQRAFSWHAEHRRDSISFICNQLRIAVR